MKYAVAIFLALGIFVGGAIAAEKCLTCGNSMYFTGETRTEWGKLQKMYKCPSGHAWWVNSSSTFTNRPDISSGPKCPSCGASVY
ncbi:MAG: hypothetical protein R6U68_12005, partial [Desulfobacteraceae bacterium]